jgi:hypothetical protein
VGTRQKHENGNRMNVGNVYVLNNPVKVITVEGIYTNTNKTLSVELCSENANIFSGTWNVGINCVKVCSKNIVKTTIYNSVNISTNLVKGYQHTKNGVQSFNPTLGSFFLKIGGSSLNQHHAFYDLSPIKWFTITTPNNNIDLKIDFWPEYTLVKQLRAFRDGEDYSLNFQIDLHLYRLQ